MSRLQELSKLDAGEATISSLYMITAQTNDELTLLYPSLLSVGLCKSVLERRTGFRTSLRVPDQCIHNASREVKQTELTVYS